MVAQLFCPAVSDVVLVAEMDPHVARRTWLHSLFALGGRVAAPGGGAVLLALRVAGSGRVAPEHEEVTVAMRCLSTLEM